jgi:hypothetical protein
VAARHAAQAVIVAQTEALLARTSELEDQSQAALRALREHAAEFAFPDPPSPYRVQWRPRRRPASA